MAHGRPPVEKRTPEEWKPRRAAYRAPAQPSKPAAPPVVHKPATVAFANGLSVGQKADVLPRGPGQWRVFLFPTGEAPFMADVAGANPEEATANAWKARQAKRDETARRSGGK